VQNVVDKIFFRKKFDYKEAVLSVSNALSAVLNLEEVVHQINHAVRTEMFIDASGVIVLNTAQGINRGYFISENDSSAAGRAKEKTIMGQDPLVELVCREKKLITKYDIAEDPHYAADREVCAIRFADLEACLAIPLIYQDNVNAIIMVGHKKSGHFFSKEDVELLVTLASHGAVSIENARMAEQMQREEIVRTNLSRYLSPQIVEGILKSDMHVNLGGDRKVVTVLFSDIRDFTRITESSPPDQLVRLLNEYFNAMAEVIFANQGSLDKYIGDAIVAVFGSLIPLDNPEMNAVNAATGMMQKLKELNRQWQGRGDFPMQMGIGINTGEVFLGNIGSAERMEFTVIGDTVNVASRFSGLARAEQILVTRTVVSRLGSDICIKEHPPSEIKGKSGLLEVFEVGYSTRESEMPATGSGESESATQLTSVACTD
jgi:adenylate cyclase